MEDDNSLATHTAEYHKAMADLRHARENFYRAIRREQASGEPAVSIARATGLTVSRIWQIIAKEEEQDAKDATAS